MSNLINRMGRPLTVTPAGGGGAREIVGVFSSRPASPLMMEGYAPSVTMMAADAEDLIYGSVVMVGGVEYRVAGRDTDAEDSGTIVLKLERQ